mgnify:CR=1 FL=1
MERLTERDDKGNLLFNGKQVYAGDFYEAVSCLEEYEDTGLDPEQIRELKEAAHRLDKIFGDEITVNQVIDFFVDFYIAQGDTARVEDAVLLTNEEAAKWRDLKERGTEKAPEVFDGHWYKCPTCGMYAGGLKGNFCHRCGQRLKWEE